MRTGVKNVRWKLCVWTGEIENIPLAAADAGRGRSSVAVAINARMGVSRAINVRARRVQVRRSPDGTSPAQRLLLRIGTLS
jgi:hypothetical protein